MEGGIGNKGIRQVSHGNTLSNSSRFLNLLLAKDAPRINFNRSSRNGVLQQNYQESKMPNLLRSIHRGSYYYAKHSRTPLEPRQEHKYGPDDGGTRSKHVGLYLGLVLVFVVLTLAILLLPSKIRSLRQRRAKRARGQGMHLRERSLRKQRPIPGKDAPGFSSPFDDEHQVGRVYSWNEPAKPESTYRRPSIRPVSGETEPEGYGELQSAAGVGRGSRYENGGQDRDGFEKAPQNGFPSPGAYFSGR
ncbi:unnamed protein product [Zymoseptoria tritici ST99CH_1A5]|nr:unnamed protein product [Zymoseptoria tritici ST99CH_1A5]